MEQSLESVCDDIIEHEGQITAWILENVHYVESNFRTELFVSPLFDLYNQLIIAINGPNIIANQDHIFLLALEIKAILV